MMQSAVRNEVAIFFTGDDVRDRAFARDLATRMVPFAVPRLVDVDELDRVDDRGGDRPEGFGTVASVFVLSPSMVAQPHNRRKLLHASPKLGVPGFTAFYICRGMTLRALRAQHPDLEPLFDKVGVGEEEAYDELLAELNRPQVTRSPGTCSPARTAEAKWAP